jgi:hypothetical protein
MRERALRFQFYLIQSGFFVFPRNNLSICKTAGNSRVCGTLENKNIESTENKGIFIMARSTPEKSRLNQTSGDLWIIELDHGSAQVYARNALGTCWVATAMLKDGRFHVKSARPEHRHALNEMKTQDNGGYAPFLLHLSSWLQSLKNRDAFARVVVVASHDLAAEAAPALGDARDEYIKMRPDNIMVKNASEDCLADEMWF